MSPIHTMRKAATRSGGGLLIAVAAFASYGCSSKTSGTTDPGSGAARYYLSATVDGVAWNEDAIQASTTGARNPGAGIFTLTAFETASFSTIAISLYNITGPGTYPLGLDVAHPAGTAQFSNTSSGWSTILAGAGGTITITTLTKDEMIGTFSFTAKGILNAPSTSTRTIASGKLDLPVK